MTRVGGALGAEVAGVDLRQPVPDDVFARLEAALVEHQVLVLRDQPIEPGHQAALARRFGEIEIHPAYPATPQCEDVRVLEHTAERPSKIEKWHSDMTFRPRPPLGTVLHGQVIPAVGGDTLFASMTAAFESLSEHFGRLVDGLHAEHSFEHGFAESLAEPGGRERLAQALRDNPPVVHPVVRRHPVDGRPAIFVNELFTTRIVELPPAESRTVLEFLWQHAVRPEHTFRVRWQPHTLVLWDNRSTQHRPVNDHGLAHRKLHRVTIAGDAPR
ncbi:MAG: TauD/TfdA family dioxygenase [Myxococcales bacterium]|nr:TauD/TfdA family dioxygenase [Myxococcales bacterium]